MRDRRFEPLPKPPGRLLMSVRGDAAPRGMTAHDRIRLTGSFAYETALSGRPDGAGLFSGNCSPPTLATKTTASRGWGTRIGYETEGMAKGRDGVSAISTRFRPLRLAI